MNTCETCDHYDKVNDTIRPHHWYRCTFMDKMVVPKWVRQLINVHGGTAHSGMFQPDNGPECPAHSNILITIPQEKP